MVAVQAEVEGLSLPVSAVVRRKLARFEDEADKKPLLVIHRARGKPELTERWGSICDAITPHSALYKWTYRIGMTVYAANLNDQTTGLDVLAEWRDALAEKFKSKASSGLVTVLAGLRDVHSTPAEFLPDERIAQAMDVLLVETEVEIIKGEG
jgi:hypothetical protein